MYHKPSHKQKPPKSSCNIHSYIIKKRMYIVHLFYTFKLSTHVQYIHIYAYSKILKSQDTILYDYCYDDHYYYCFNSELRRDNEQFIYVRCHSIPESGLLAYRM